jgi:DNA polymerase elongation subunit (family B)
VAIYFGPSVEGAGPEGVISLDDPKEERLLIAVNDFFMDAETDPGIIVTWNGAGFDGPVYQTRAERYGLRHNLRLQPTKLRPSKYGPCAGHETEYLLAWGPHDHADICYAYEPIAEAAGISKSLKPVARLMGLNPIEVDRERMELLTVAERTAYNVSDGEMTYRMALMLSNLRQIVDSRDWV